MLSSSSPVPADWLCCRIVFLPRLLWPWGVNALVAHFSVKRARLRAGESVLVRGASGGIGAMVAQRAVRSGAVATAVAKSDSAEDVSTLGVWHVVRRGVDPEPQGPFDVIIDPVAGDAVRAHRNPLAQRALCGKTAQQQGSRLSTLAGLCCRVFHDPLPIPCSVSTLFLKMTWLPQQPRFSPKQLEASGLSVQKCCRFARQFVPTRHSSRGAILVRSYSGRLDGKQV